jgi:glutamate formiminotransferase
MNKPSRPLLLAIPNLSEGRNSAFIEQCAEVIQRTEGVKLIDHSSDPDHNRSVFTYLGPPQAVLEASKALAQLAVQEIDMRNHRGSHPRLGALDVMPFVPLRNMEMKEAVEISRQMGKFLGELGVPVYYYEQSATRPERENLPNIRKGEYEGLIEKIQDPDWKPDEGPAVFNPKSGATVCGARFPLIAFNINLNSRDIELANRIAKTIRHINGGYRYVRAMGVDLQEKGMVQVSINMINYTKTPLHRVLETVRFEAARYGVSVAGTEIIGSIPLDALEEIVRFYLQCHDFSINQVIETALMEN